DREAVEAIRQSMNGQVVANKTVLVPPIEHVKIRIQSPVLKCFRQTECDMFGADLVNRLKSSNTLQNIVLQPISGREDSTAIRPFHFEAWLPPLVRPKS